MSLCRYLGKDRSMIVPNTLFRMGASAIVLTNKPAERRRAKYELQHVVRVHLGADDKAYEWVATPAPVLLADMPLKVLNEVRFRSTGMSQTCTACPAGYTVTAFVMQQLSAIAQS